MVYYDVFLLLAICSLIYNHRNVYNNHRIIVVVEFYTPHVLQKSDWKKKMLQIDSKPDNNIRIIRYTCS